MNVVVAPKQLRSNCWFNVFFMVFFISDKGRSFFRHLRQTMITGVKSVNNEQIKKYHILISNPISFSIFKIVRNPHVFNDFIDEM